MTGKIQVVRLSEPSTDPDGVYVNTTSSAGWSRGLSPFVIGPCPLYDKHVSLNMENGWQYSKVYTLLIDEHGNPTDAYFKWASFGWAAARANRYPMGKGARPAYSWWDGAKLGYVDARKRIYVPLYARAVASTPAYAKLLEMWNSVKEQNKTLYLQDYDAYRHQDLNMSLLDVLNYPNKKMGHAFVLMMLLMNDDALRSCTV